MKYMIALVKLTVETKDREFPKDLVRYCFDNEASEEGMETWVDSAVGKAMAYGKLADCENTVSDMGNYRLVEAYALEFYMADDNGDFVSGSDYDW